MTKDEAVEILRLIEGAYPHFMKGTDEQVQSKVKVWMYHLEKMDYERTLENVHEHIASSEYAPSIAEIRPIVYKFDSVKKKIDAVFADD